MEFYQICTKIAFVATKKLRSDLESPHFLTFSAKCQEFKIGVRDGHGKSRNGHGKVMEKYFVKSVGTLNETTCSSCVELRICKRSVSCRSKMWFGISYKYRVLFETPFQCSVCLLLMLSLHCV